MLKGAVVGGPSIVFMLCHEARVMKLCEAVHQTGELCLSKCILGYDVNALYVSTKLRDIPCRKENSTIKIQWEWHCGLPNVSETEVDIEIADPL